MYLQVYDIWEATASGHNIGAPNMRNNYGGIPLSIFSNIATVILVFSLLVSVKLSLLFFFDFFLVSAFCFFC